MPPNTRDTPAADRDLSRLSAPVEQLGVNSDELDRLVHDVFSKAASDLNNTGPGAQISALLRHIAPGEIELEIRDAAARRDTSVPADPTAGENVNDEASHSAGVHVTDPMKAGNTSLDVEVTTTASSQTWTLDAATAALVREAIRVRTHALTDQARRENGNPRSFDGARHAAAAYRLHAVEDATLAAEVQRSGTVPRSRRPSRRMSGDASPRLPVPPRHGGTDGPMYVTPLAVRDAIAAVVAYSMPSERVDYELQDHVGQDNHIFLQLSTVEDWLRTCASATAAVLAVQADQPDTGTADAR